MSPVYDELKLEGRLRQPWHLPREDWESNDRLLSRKLLIEYWSTEKHKIHLPKPVRFASSSLPRNDSFESNTISISPSQGRDQGCFGAEAWRNFKDIDTGASFLVGDVDRYDLANGSDLECQSLVPTTNTMEKLYEECLQLLEIDDHQDKVLLDSFADSLLA
ncbi:hypothetical protein SADUNF_Sadunf14G0071900 [Salix dunnii]|uniref:Uncharacterized protein n=1 Tax=Salix dunnii TaxID=1413687 RepID=A0A835JDB3_9ROSI|nr:hypothetical protein SADUNF_Sadunf14G0071900 [Salix dunnii]